MKWYDKFKVGQKVRVAKKIQQWRLDDFNGGRDDRGAEWVSDMDKTIGGVFEIVDIDTDIGYRLRTRDATNYDYNYWYPVESLQSRILVGEQLLFNFMNEE